MRRWLLVWSLVGLLSSTLGFAAESKRKKSPKVVPLLDGAELVHFRVPGASQVEFRFVVRSGGAQDPEQKAGLASLVQRAVFEGSYTTTRTVFLDKIRRVGGQVYGVTTPEATLFALNVPRAAWSASVGTYLEMLTNPSLGLVNVSAIRKHVSDEPQVGLGGATVWQLDHRLFGAKSSVIGTTESRARIQRSDFVSYYGRHYLPSNTSIVVVGDPSVQAVTALLNDNLRWPPDLKKETLPSVDAEPRLPMTAKVASSSSGTLLGYALARPDRPACRELAAWLELRLLLEGRIERPVVGHFETFCYAMRGQVFLFASVFSRTSPPPAQSDLLKQVFGQLISVPLSASVKKRLRRRVAQQTADLLSDPRRLADMLAREVAVSRTAQPALELGSLLSVPRLDGPALAELAQQSFIPERQVLVTLSPP